MDDDDDIYD